MNHVLNDDKTRVFEKNSLDPIKKKSQERCLLIEFFHRNLYRCVAYL